MLIKGAPGHATKSSSYLSGTLGLGTNSLRSGPWHTDIGLGSMYWYFPQNKGRCGNEMETSHDFITGSCALDNSPEWKTFIQCQVNSSISHSWLWFSLVWNNCCCKWICCHVAKRHRDLGYWGSIPTKTTIKSNQTETYNTIYVCIYIYIYITSHRIEKHTHDIAYTHMNIMTSL